MKDFKGDNRFEDHLRIPRGSRTTRDSITPSDGDLFFDQSIESLFTGGDGGKWLGGLPTYYIGSGDSFDFDGPFEVPRPHMFVIDRASTVTNAPFTPDGSNNHGCLVYIIPRTAASTGQYSLQVVFTRSPDGTGMWMRSRGNTSWSNWHHIPASGPSYSTVARVAYEEGRWTNGDQIWKRTYNFNDVLSAGINVTINHGITDMDRPIKIEGMVERNTGDWYPIPTGLGDGTDTSISVRITNTQIIIEADSGFDIGNGVGNAGHITLYYTRT